ncbi:MAG: NAD(P)H-dependent oxidoreductase [Brevibacterium sp.]|uniref:NADPH-dependent FMN reductase n=1 Tax=Brevibacterium sp. TaxID=1701 RepID=UPI00264794FE|nr:NADPH-dependent FMN reductase [Brevibacterium sp.]MDN5833240.1 NAD(P)H-dependent oxidoreductase [Brevibacterium sp.]MDN5875862.1 NAD(P)H-dependent oxidoreductase [Brevibacterium sp.]MDN5908201.1 NAD(P)H-dependent oxidoreductase [Brevibacterium sp.]MDN6122244.1 NAD(P)H-dependent oxidoreductase [Brevibacterium sp.]MDN6132819.1 NAD(P)H-dependent oxidoreductase [Brevibacterium sp.]
MPKHISVLVGSLRCGSYAHEIAKQAIELLPDDCQARIVEVRGLPLYDFDYDDPDIADRPAPEIYDKFRETIKASDDVLLVTAENNRTIPACLKNAINIGFKPNSEGVNLL